MEYANNDFKKGRAFGTEGEWDAADYLFREMGNLSLNPILDEIQEITTGFESYPIIEPKKIDITDRLDVTSQSLTINESGSEYADLAESEFFILPRWNYSEFKDKNNHFLLTHDYSYDDLHIRTDKFHKYWDRPILKNIVKILAEIDNGNISDINDLMNFTKSLIENEFDFTFEDLDINNSSTWPSFFDGDFSLYSEPYLLFAEDPWNNYDPDLPNSLIFLLKLRPHGIFGFGWKLLKFQFQQWWHMGLTNETGNFIGNLFYDFSDNSETHNMPFLLMARPMIFINGEYGEYMMDPDKDLDDFTLDLTWSQEFEEDMLSYNVIGEIVGEDTSKTILVQCLYDSWWCEGTADSAIGMGIVMGIAKYLKELETDYGIKPKYNIQFVACAGEEVGLRGAFYHRANNTGNTGDIPYVIDLNQVAFDERDDIGRPGGDNLTYYVWVMDSNETDHLFLFPKTKALKNEVNAVAEESNYFDRTGGEDFFKVERDPGVPSDQVPYKDATSQDVEPKTILFLKDTGWTLHHRTGQEHAEGDVMEYYDSTDVAVTAEMILNVTKHYAYNSNCWIDGDVAYCAYDQDSDGKVDTIKATFEIETDIPDDPVTVRATFENNNIILNNKTMDKRFNYVIPTNGIEVTVQMTIPPTGDEDHYKLKIELLNVTERISDKLTIGQKYPNGESNITDYSPFYVYLYHRGNTEPNKPSLSGPETLKLREENYFTTSATDPNGDDVTFKFYWDYERILGEKEYNEDEIFNSGEECIKGHTYNWPTEKTIRVEAKDCFTNLFDWKKLSWSKNGEWSVLSDPLEYDSDDFENSLDITMSPYSQYSSDSLVAVKYICLFDSSTAAISRICQSPEVICLLFPEL